jgi:hypothetical protein
MIAGVDVSEGYQLSPVVTRHAAGHTGQMYCRPITRCPRFTGSHSQRASCATLSAHIVYVLM